MNIFRILFLLIIVRDSRELKQNVLFIIVDDLRPALGIYGDKNAYTPNINALGRKSFVFTEAFSQQALCAPSRNSFLTSRRPDSLHLYDFYSYWRDTIGNFTTLPQHFRENGYFAHSIGKVFHPGISSNFTDDAKYSWSDDPYHPPTEIYKEAKVCLSREGTLARNLMCPVTVEEQPGANLPDLESLSSALEFLDKQKNKSAPYFLAVGFHKPHIPLKFPRKYLKYHPLQNINLPLNHFRPALLPTVAWNHWYDVRRRDDIAALNISFPFGLIPDEDAKKIIQSYNAATTYIDDIIGKLLRKVDKNTIIVFTADHGWSLSEHGEFSKFSNFDVATRVPLIIHVPRLSKELTIINELVELVDIFPTLVDLSQVSDSLGICMDSSENSKLCTEGRSLVPLMASKIRNTDYVWKQAVFNQYPRSGIFPTLHPNSDKPHMKDIKIMGYSMRTKQYRYTEWVEFNHRKCAPNWKNVLAKEMYDHEFDPDENLNLALKSELNATVHLLSNSLRLGWKFT